MFAFPSLPAIDAMFIRPLPRPIMCGGHAREQWKTPSRSTSMTRRHAPGRVLDDGRCRPGDAALFTSTSIRPRRSTTVAAIASADRSSVTSSSTARTSSRSGQDEIRRRDTHPVRKEAVDDRTAESAGAAGHDRDTRSVFCPQTRMLILVCCGTMTAAPPLSPVRRVVTGHDADGRAVISSDGAPPTVVALDAVPGTVFHEIWSTGSVPARIDNGADPTLGELRLDPPAGGTRIRVVDIPPDSVQNAISPDAAAAAFAQIGASQAHAAEGPHALMHRTESLDYGIVLAGEVWLVVDDGERGCARATSSSSAARTTHGRTARTGRRAWRSCSSTGSSPRTLRRPEEARLMAVVLRATWTANEGRGRGARRTHERRAGVARGAGLPLLPGLPRPGRAARVPHLRGHDDEDAVAAHTSSEHFERFVLGQAVPLLQSREREFFETIDV